MKSKAQYNKYGQYIEENTDSIGDSVSAADKTTNQNAIRVKSEF